MEAYDFEYDGIRLSDMGYMICIIDTSLENTIPTCIEMTPNTISTFGGKKYELTSNVYDDTITSTFEICKRCNEDWLMSVEDVRKIARWLNRVNYHKLKFIGNEYSEFFYEAKFNISQVEKSGKIFGLQLKMVTNKPYATHDLVRISFSPTKESNYVIQDFSDEEGYLCPEVDILINEDCDLNIKVSHDNETLSDTVIKNCKSGEFISLNYPTVKSSLSDHKIADDFNWDFLKIGNVFGNSKNKVSISNACKINISYYPIVKFGV